MKFLALKAALDKALPPPPAATKIDPPPKLPVIPFYSPKEKKQTVVGGDILRTPVDRTAALVTRPAPWWAKAPPEPPKPPEPLNPPKRKKAPMSQSPELSRTRHPAEDPRAVNMGEKKSEDMINAELAVEAVRRTKKSVEDAEDLVARASDARAALDLMANEWKESWFKFLEGSDERLKRLRMDRMAFDTETKLLMNSLREVRQFFLDKDHDAELVRLREFVDLCERLQKLKSSGFLDTVADTILKLS